MKVYGLDVLRLRQGVSTLVLAGLMLLICPLSKADSVYTSAAAFDAATTGLTTISFDGYAVAPDYGYGLNGNPLDIGSAEFKIFGPGSIVTGQNQYVQTPAYTDGAFLFADYGTPDHMLATFPGSHAVGFNVGGVFGDPSSITVTLSDHEQVVLTGLNGDNVEAGSIGFLGFTSAHSITSVDIVFQPATVNGTQFGGLDNFSFGSALVPPVPEPSGLVLLGSGAVAAAGAFRRRIFRG